MNIIDMRTVKVRFHGTEQSYSYFVPDGDQPEVGDYVVTSVSPIAAEDEDYGLSPTERRLTKANVDGVHVAKIVAVDAHQSPKATRQYLHLVRRHAVLERNEKNKSLRETIVEHKAILAKLDALLLEQSKIEHYRRLALVNPDAKKLLEQLGIKPDEA